MLYPTISAAASTPSYHTALATPPPILPVSVAGPSQSGLPSPATPADIPKSAFKSLTWVLIEAEKDDRSPMPSVVVAQKLSGQGPTLYQKAGVTKFKEYLDLAVAKGIVRVEPAPLGGDWGQARISRVKPTKR